MLPRTYAAATNMDSASMASTASTMGRPSIGSDWYSPLILQWYILGKFTNAEGFEIHVASIGLNEAYRQIAIDLAQNAIKPPSTKEIKLCAQRIKNWWKPFRPRPESKIYSSTPRVKPSTSENWSMSTVDSPFNKQPLGGLRNYGNTCYVNVALQLLRCVDEIKSLILKCHSFDLIDSENLNKQLLVAELKKLFISLDRCSVSETIAMHPYISDVIMVPDVNTQQDTQELFSALCSVLHEVFREGSGSVVENALSSRSLSKVTCLKCNHERSTSASDWVLPLGIPKHEISLMELLSLRDIPTTVQGVYCKKCERKTTSKQGQSLDRPAPYLMLQLKRFVFDRSTETTFKNCARVTFTEKMDVSCSTATPYCQASNDSKEYELAAVAVHSGSSLSSGHYYMLQKTSAGWFKFNDDIVKEATDMELKWLMEGGSEHETPYLLLYRKPVTGMSSTITVPAKSLIEQMPTEVYGDDRKTSGSSHHAIPITCPQMASKHVPIFSCVNGTDLDAKDQLNTKAGRNSERALNHVGRHTSPASSPSSKWSSSVSLDYGSNDEVVESAARTENASLPSQLSPHHASSKSSQSSSQSSSDCSTSSTLSQNMKSSGSDEEELSFIDDPESGNLSSEVNNSHQENKRTHKKVPEKTDTNSRTSNTHARKRDESLSSPSSSSSPTDVKSAKVGTSVSDGWKTIYGQNLKRRGQTMRYSAKAYCSYEFAIPISPEEWQTCTVKWKSGKYHLKKEGWEDLILKLFEDKDPEHHTVNFKSCGKLLKSKKRGLSLLTYRETG